MAWIATDKNGDIGIHESEPQRDDYHEDWDSSIGDWVYVSVDACIKLTGKVLTWEDEPIEI